VYPNLPTDIYRQQTKNSEAHRQNIDFKSYPLLILILNANYYLVDFVAGLLSKNPKIIPRRKNSCFFKINIVDSTSIADQ